MNKVTKCCHNLSFCLLGLKIELSLIFSCLVILEAKDIISSYFEVSMLKSMTKDIRGASLKGLDFAIGANYAFYGVDYISELLSSEFHPTISASNFCEFRIHLGSIDGHLEKCLKGYVI